MMDIIKAVKPVALLALALALLAGCNKKGPQNKEAVRQGVIDYLNSRTNLAMSSMNVDVTAVTFKDKEADATVAFSPKGSGGASQGMTMRYTLEWKNDRWVVKGKADSGHGGAMGGAMGGGMGGAMGGANPHGGGTDLPAMPPGHPPTKGAEKK